MSGRAYSARALVFTACAALLVGGAIGFLAPRQRSTSLGAPPAVVTAPPGSPFLRPVQADEVFQVGESGTTNSLSTVTVLGWTDGADGWPEPGEGTKYSKVWVRFCSGPTVSSFGIRQIPLLFSVVDSEGTPSAGVVGFSAQHLDELNTYVEGKIAPSQCVTGSIVFNTADDAPLQKVLFTGMNQFAWDISGLTGAGAQAPTPSIEPGLSPAPSPPAA